MDAWWFLLLPASYLLGMFPTALLVGRLTGHDPTNEGSGNPGASNTWRVAGRRAGVAVLLGDVAKGGLAASLGLLAGGRALGTACGLAAMIGHIVPLTRGFRGGKGVATLGGAVLVLHTPVGIGLLVVYAAVMKLIRIASVASLSMALLLPIGVAVTGRARWEVAAMTIAMLVVLVRHRANIERLRRGEEGSLIA